MERRSSKIGVSLHTKKMQACTNSPCLSSLVAQNVLFQPASSVTSVWSSCKFLWPYHHLGPYVFSILAGLGSVLLEPAHSIHTWAANGLLQTRNLYFYQWKNNSWSHRSVASRPIEWQLETQGHSPFLCTLAIQRACPEDWAYAAMSGCSPWPNHTSG